MKYFFPVLMAAVILIGLLVNITPYIAGYFVPIPESGYQKARTEEALQALGSWFGVPDSEFKQVDAILKRSPDGNWRWYRFEVPRTPVERFIRRTGLQQYDLQPATLQAKFMAHVPPVDWWKPAELQRKSYFAGQAGNQLIRLLYNAGMQRGYLLVLDTAVVTRH